MKKIALHADLMRANIGKSQILSNIELPITAGCWTAIVGPNGAGKSSLLRCLAGLWTTHRAASLQGGIRLRDEELLHMPSQRRAQEIAWLGQSESASEELRVWDVVMLGRLPHMGWMGSPQALDHAACEQALRAVQALDWRERLLGELSVGERQRVLVARALASQAPIMLMDEPLAHLDAPHQADWLALVRALTRAGTTVVSVLHELPMALQADELVVMRAGRLVYQGAANEEAWRVVEAVFDQRFTIEVTPWGPMISYQNAEEHSEKSTLKDALNADFTRTWSG
jgi:iron complex transport system ATP-binding protein